MVNWLVSCGVRDRSTFPFPQWMSPYIIAFYDFHGRKGVVLISDYNLELLRAAEGTLSRWSPLHLQSLAPTPVSSRVDVRQARRKNNCRIFTTT
jgi:hypothetical protein